MKILYDPHFWTGVVVGWVAYSWLTTILPIIIGKIVQLYLDWKWERGFRKRQEERRKSMERERAEFIAKREKRVNKYFGTDEGQPRLYGGSDLDAWEHEWLDKIEQHEKETTQKKLIDPKNYTEYDELK